MSDPDAVREPTPPPQPPRPSATTQQGHTSQSQLEADEQYARQLAEHYDSRSYGRSSSGQRGRRQQNAPPPNDDDDRNFFDDELPVIKENFQKGFLEAQSKFNGWISSVKKKFDGDDDAEQSSQKFGAGSQNAGRRSGDNSRRSGDYNKYDADPQVLGDDFASMQLNQDGMSNIDFTIEKEINKMIQHPNVERLAHLQIQICSSPLRPSQRMKAEKYPFKAMIRMRSTAVHQKLPLLFQVSKANGNHYQM